MNRDIIHTQAQLDDRACQLNPNSPAHQAALDNRANQMNPNNPAHKGGCSHGK